MTTKRDFLKLADLTLPEAREVLTLTERLKREPKGRRTQLLAGRAVAIVLEKASTRTRVSFEVGCAQLGAHPVVLGVQGSQIGPRRADSRHGSRARALLRRDRLPDLQHDPAGRDGDGERAGDQRALRRRPSRPGAMRYLHGRGAARRPSRANESPSSGTAGATWPARGSRRRRSSASTWCSPGRASTCLRRTRSHAPARTSRSRKSPAPRWPVATS